MPTMRRIALIIPVLALVGCADASPTTQRVGGGAAIGALGGAAIGSFSGNAGMGALVGAGVGAAGGYLYDQSQQNQQRAYQQGVAAGRSGR
jgi:membrane associated rhomboid family serine protease